MRVRFFVLRCAYLCVYKCVCTCLAVCVCVCTCGCEVLCACCVFVCLHACMGHVGHLWSVIILRLGSYFWVCTSFQHWHKIVCTIVGRFRWVAGACCCDGMWDCEQGWGVWVVFSCLCHVDSRTCVVVPLLCRQPVVMAMVNPAWLETAHDHMWLWILDFHYLHMWAWVLGLCVCACRIMHEKRLLFSVWHIESNIAFWAARVVHEVSTGWVGLNTRNPLKACKGGMQWPRERKLCMKQETNTLNSENFMLLLF